MLEGLTVIEVGEEPAVRFCGWLFAMNDATVVRLADSDRQSPRSDSWNEHYLNTRKSIVAPESVDATRRAELSADADIVIGDPDIDWAQFDSNRSITGTVDGFGVDGPYAAWQGNELVYATLGGASGYTFTREGTPVYGFGDRYQYLAGMYLYQAVCACVLQADMNRATPEATTVPRVRISNFESVVSLLPYLTTQYEYNGVESTTEQSGPRFVSECEDGFIVVYAGFAWEPIATALDRLDLLDDVRFVENGARFENIAALGEVLDEWAATKTVEQACSAGRERNVAITEVRSPEAALSEESLAHRGAWYDLRVDGKKGRIPAMPYTANDVRPHVGEKVSMA